MIFYLQTKPFDENQSKPACYRENEYCKFHKIKRHSTNHCMRLKNYIQDLIDRGDIELEGGENTSKNKNLGIYKDPFPKHDPTPPPTNQGQNDQANNIHYKTTSHSYDVIIGYIEYLDNHVTTIKVKTVDCAITTRHNKITVQRPPPPTLVGQYNLIEQLEKNPAQIPILDLLRTSLVHKKVLYKIL